MAINYSHFDDDGNGKGGHVNMMTDTVIANLPPDGLRAVLRSMLGCHPRLTSTFEREAKSFVEQHVAITLRQDAQMLSLAELRRAQRIVRCMLGIGNVFQSFPLLSKIVAGGARALQDSQAVELEVHSFLASVDGDLVQAMTAVDKTLSVSSGVRRLTNEEEAALQLLFDTLTSCKKSFLPTPEAFPYTRGLIATAGSLGVAGPSMDVLHDIELPGRSPLRPLHEAQETMMLGNKALPRIFSGLWQMSSPAWGSASATKIFEHFSKHVEYGFTAFDMADHYGDAEVVFGRFRAQHPHKEAIFAATKYCVFHPMTVTREAVQANVGERCRRVQQDKLDLLQFHWQHYENLQYLDALRYLAEDDRVGMIGLCNFDTEHMQRVLDDGIPIHTNQVQFSLIDSRPLERMAPVCEKYGVKLLTYGTLCGGFLADKWLDQAEPDLYSESVTPSQRKYYGMICSWGGWSLFQNLLQTLKVIATKHKVNISNVATRWVLDVPCVGAVLVGARMGVSDHSDANAATFGWNLDAVDQNSIEEVLRRSKRSEILGRLGDCGGEYRSLN